MRNVIIVIVVIAIAAGAWVFFKARGVQQAAVKWEGPVPEITSEKISKENDVVTVNLTSRIDAPVADVFDAFQNPERSQGLVEEIKVAKVLSGDDKKKTVEFHITTLGQLQVLTVDLTYRQGEERDRHQDGRGRDRHRRDVRAVGVPGRQEDARHLQRDAAQQAAPPGAGVGRAQRDQGAVRQPDARHQEGPGAAGKDRPATRGWSFASRREVAPSPVRRATAHPCR